MMRLIKPYLKKILSVVIKILTYGKIGRLIQDEIVNNSMVMHKKIRHNKCSLTFTVPNKLNLMRVDTFSTKEPETLEWIDNMSDGSVLWDIGANIGLYSCYAAKKKRCKVFSFEPSVFNLELLARNIFINNLNESVYIVPIALTDTSGFSSFQLTTTEWGGALSTFGENFGWDGEKIKKIFEFNSIGLSMDEAIIKLNMKFPDYIKIDVDGIEHFILRGGIGVLNKIKGILIEVNDNFLEQAKGCHDLLIDAGLSLYEKRHSEMMANSMGGFDKCYNQIWVRK
jgi:FkbM family methyltransferase